jgi:hypothetical protein
LYNPFDAKDPLNLIFSKFISSINDVIASQSQTSVFTLVDVNNAFSGNSEAVKFSLTTAQIDPHPTNAGHDIIYKQLVAVEKPLNPPAAPVDNGNAGTGTDKGNTTVDNQNGTNNGGTDQGPTGLTDEQKNAITKAIADANQEKALSVKSLKKSQDDAAKYDKDYKNLKAKAAKLKTKAEKDALNLQLAAADAQKKAAAAYADYYKAVIAKDDLVIKSEQAILDSTNPSADDISTAQANTDAAGKLAAAKKTAADKAAALAKQAAAKAAKTKK